MSSSKLQNYSVVMSVYKNDKPEWFSLAIDSLLNQTIISDDIVLVIDGPIGKEFDSVVTKYGKENSNINVVRLKENSGLGSALNVAINNAKNELIGRMDSDDISVFNRFELQLAEFNKNPTLAIVGGQIAEFIDNPEEIVSYRKVPTDSVGIKEFSRRRSPFNHPTVMYKKSVIEKLGGYDITAIRIEDYDLWLRAIDAEVGLKNVDDVLLYYRSNPNSMKRRKTFNSLRNHTKARFRFYKKGYISSIDFIYGAVTQALLFVMPVSLSQKVFNKAVRR